MRRLVPALQQTEAAEIAEAAMVMPVVFIFLLGIIWFGRAFNIYSTITQAAQQGAIVAARPSCATCGNTFAGNGVVGSCPSANPTVACAVAAVLQASSLDPTQIMSSAGTPSSGCTSSSNILICREVMINATTTPAPVCADGGTDFQICGATVSFRFPVPFYVPFTSLTAGSFTVSVEAQSRMEN
jgi:Flp pilus assembly protein TadG